MTRPLVAINYGFGSATAWEVLQAASDRADILFLATDPALEDDAVAFLSEVAQTVDARGHAPHVIAAHLRENRCAGLTTFSESLIRSTAAFAQMAGLTSYHTPDVALRLTNKALQRLALATATESAVSAEQVESEAQALDAARRIGYPVVLKPTTGSGGAFTKLAEAPTDLASAWQLMSQKVAGPWLVEQTLIGDASWAGPGWGPYVSVESVSMGGARHTMAVSGKTPTDPPARETGTFVPSTLSPGALELVSECAHEALTAVGVENGVTHTEIMLTADGPRVIEINGRLGGEVGQTMRNAGLNDPVEAALASAALDPDWLSDVLAQPRNPDKVAFDWSLILPGDEPVRIRDIHGLDEVLSLPHVDGARLSARPGDLVDPRLGIAAYLGHVNGVAPSHADLQQTLSRLRDAFTVDATSVNSS